MASRAIGRDAEADEAECEKCTDTSVAPVEAGRGDDLRRPTLGSDPNLLDQVTRAERAPRLQADDFDAVASHEVVVQSSAGHPGRAAGLDDELLRRVRLTVDAFVDPRLGGGKQSPRTHEDLVQLLQIDGKEYLFYRAFPVDVAVIRATTADENGNLTMEEEPYFCESFSIAS